MCRRRRHRTKSARIAYITRTFTLYIEDEVVFQLPSISTKTKCIVKYYFFLQLMKVQVCNANLAVDTNNLETFQWNVNVFTWAANIYATLKDYDNANGWDYIRTSSHMKRDEKKVSIFLWSNTSVNRNKFPNCNRQAKIFRMVQLVIGNCW